MASLIPIRVLVENDIKFHDNSMEFFHKNTVKMNKIFNPTEWHWNFMTFSWHFTGMPFSHKNPVEFYQNVLIFLKFDVFFDQKRCQKMISSVMTFQSHPIGFYYQGLLGNWLYLWRINSMSSFLLNLLTKLVLSMWILTSEN